MQLNKVLKGLMLALPVLAIVACSSNKSADHDQSGTGASGSGIDSNMSSEERARLEMEALQKNNIVYFGFNKYDITPDFSEMLDFHAKALRDNSARKVTVHGYADERGTPEYNIALGEHRANAVKMYLQGRGVAADQVSIVSYGKEKPAVLGHDEAAYAKNRRAVLIY